MTPDQIAELLDLFLDGELPTALQAYVETYLSSHPEAARDADSLRDTVARLRAAPTPRPDTWHVERLLDSLLRENATARPNAINNTR